MTKTVVLLEEVRRNPPGNELGVEFSPERDSQPLGQKDEVILQV